MGKKKKILIVDDDYSSRRLLERIIRSHFKCDVMQAKEGSEALQAMFMDRPDLVVLDLHMPFMNGVQVLEAVKESSALREIPIIACTGVSNDSLVRKVLQYGVKSYLVKPVEPNTVIEKITMVLES